MKLDLKRPVWIILDLLPASGAHLSFAPIALSVVYFSLATSEASYSFTTTTPPFLLLFFFLLLVRKLNLSDSLLLCICVSHTLVPYIYSSICGCINRSDGLTCLTGQQSATTFST